MSNSKNNTTTPAEGFRALADEASDMFAFLNANHEAWDEGKMSDELFYETTYALALKMVMLRNFRYADKSGTGIKGFLTLAEVFLCAVPLAVSEEYNAEGETLRNWAVSAAVGDKWESLTMRLERIE
jgi:hypothetical protein